MNKNGLCKVIRTITIPIQWALLFRNRTIATPLRLGYKYPPLTPLSSTTSIGFLYTTLEQKHAIQHCLAITVLAIQHI